MKNCPRFSNIPLREPVSPDHRILTHHFFSLNFHPSKVAFFSKYLILFSTSLSSLSTFSKRLLSSESVGKLLDLRREGFWKMCRKTPRLSRTRTIGKFGARKVVSKVFKSRLWFVWRSAPKNGENWRVFWSRSGKTTPTARKFFVYDEKVHHVFKISKKSSWLAWNSIKELYSFLKMRSNLQLEKS